MKIVPHAPNPKACRAMDAAIADAIIIRGEAFNFSRCPMIIHMINCARNLPTSYTPPSPEEIWGLLINRIYDINFANSVKLLTTNATVYGVSLFGDEATIITYPLVNFLGAGVYCQFFVLNIFYWTGHCKEGKKKDAPDIANFFLPILKDLEKRNPEGKFNVGIIDLVLFDGATDVQNDGNIMSMRYPRITVIHGTEHVVWLPLKEFYNKIPEFALLRNVTWPARNMFVSTRHATKAMFGIDCKKNNKGIKIGFIKPCDVRMIGDFT